MVGACSRAARFPGRICTATHTWWTGTIRWRPDGASLSRPEVHTAAAVPTCSRGFAWPAYGGPSGAASSGPRGTTIGFSLNFLNGAVGTGLTATARVIQCGRSVQVCEVDVRGAAGEAVARAMVTYKLDHKGEVRSAVS